MATYLGVMDPDLPFFRQESGGALTKSLFNDLLKELLAPYVNYAAATVSLHSFRAGLVSHMMSLGFTEAEARQSGRWSSSAWKSYMKSIKIGLCKSSCRNVRSKVELTSVTSIYRVLGKFYVFSFTKAVVFCLDLINLSPQYSRAKHIFPSVIQRFLDHLRKVITGFPPI